MAISWDYEETTPGYYHIYAPNGPLDGRLTTIAITVPETPENTLAVIAIVRSLKDIERRLLVEADKDA
jgi:hypothetical protein